MNFKDFHECLKGSQEGPRIRVSGIQKIIDDHHTGVGRITNKWLADFTGADFGNFIWLEEDRTSAYEAPFSDAVVFINDRFKGNREMVRLIAAKESMHVFDGREQQARDGDAFRRLLSEIANNPMEGADVSAAYNADREALWKAIISLVPPWSRAEYKDAWDNGHIKAHELAIRWSIPERTAAQAMSPYYDKAQAKFGIAS